MGDLLQLVYPVAKPPAALPPPSDTPDKHKFSPVWIVLVLCVYLATVFGFAISNNYWLNIVFFPLCLVLAPITYHLYKRWAATGAVDGSRVRRGDMGRAFFNGFFSATGLALIAETIFALLFLVIFFGAKKPKIFDGINNEDFTKFKKDPAIHVFAVFFAFLGSGLFEELSKYYVIEHCFKLYLKYPAFMSRVDIDSFLWIGIFVGIGFGSMDAVMFTCVTNGNHAVRQVIALLVRLIVQIPFQTALAYIWATKLARRDIILRRGQRKGDSSSSTVARIRAPEQERSNWRYILGIGYRQILLHGLYDFLKLECFIIAGNARIGYLALSGLIGGVVLLVAIYFAFQMQKSLYESKELVADVEDDGDIGL
jgi:hypothetical protein